MIAANTQWNDAEFALKMARCSYDRWFVAGGEDTRSPAIMHAYHTHEALHEAARAITMLIETSRTEAAALITTPAHGSDIPAQRRRPEPPYVERRRESPQHASLEDRAAIKALTWTNDGLQAFADK